MEDNIENNLEDLIYDLRDLGIGEDKVYIELYAIGNSGFYSVGKLAFPKFNKIRGAINYKDVVRYLIIDEYEIKLNSYTTVDDYSIRELIYEMCHHTKNADIEELIKDIANYLINITRIDLVVDGKIIISKEKEQRYL